MVLYVWYFMYGTLCMVLYVWYFMYGTLCMVLYVWYFMYGTLCMVLYVWYFMYGMQPRTNAQIKSIDIIILEMLLLQTTEPSPGHVALPSMMIIPQCYAQI